MNKRTIYTLPKDSEPNGENLKALIDLHQGDITTFAILESYVDDDPLIQRDSPNALLAINNFANYITSINIGYLLGNPVDYTDNTDTEKTVVSKLDPIVENYTKQNIAELDTDIAEDCSMFGQAFENVFMDEETTATSAKLSVYNTIVVYDNTFKKNKMFAVYYATKLNAKGEDIKETYDVTVFTKTNTIEGVLAKKAFTEESTTPHAFEAVPVIHYMNNRRLKGDYETVISLIDAYNILQSDRVIDREKLVDAILVFYGARLTEEDQKALKENRTVGLQDGAKAEYLIKNIDEADSDVLRKTIGADIHKFSMTPDLTDESFGNSPSGVSLLYKLLPFENNTKTKERLFDVALMQRFALYAKIMKKLSKTGGIELQNVKAVFKRSLPNNNVEISEMINNLVGLVSQETLIGQLDFVTDASAEVNKAKEEATPVTDPNFGTDNFTKE